MFIAAGYVLAMLMGLTLGLIGAGGSILTVPIMVYLLHIQPVAATAYSLLIVGSTALLGAISYWRNGEVFFREAVLFAIPAMSAVLFTRAVLVPAIPEVILGITKDNFIMIIFSLMMLTAGISMLVYKTRQQHQSKFRDPYQLVKILLGSLSVGVVTGIVGAGGGFLIIPSLIAIFRFQIKQAIGTSLAIIAVNSLVGFNGDLSTGFEIDWSMIGLFLSMTLIGVLLGVYISQRVDGKKLQTFFSLFLIVLGLVILIDQF